MSDTSENLQTKTPLATTEALLSSVKAEREKSLATTEALLSNAKENRLNVLASANKNIAKNRIARFVIYSFCITVLVFVLFILYGALFTDSESWKEAITPIMDILQKVFIPIVTLAFGFYNSASTDKD